MHKKARRMSDARARLAWKRVPLASGAGVSVIKAMVEWEAEAEGCVYRLCRPRGGFGAAAGSVLIFRVCNGTGRHLGSTDTVQDAKLVCQHDYDKRIKGVITTKLMARVVFCGDLDLDPDPQAAAAELRPAGYTVHRYPDEYQKRLAHPRDDFLEAVTDGPDDFGVIRAIMHEVGVIADRYGGFCEECGPIDATYVPFGYLKVKKWN